MITIYSISKKSTKAKILKTIRLMLLLLFVGLFGNMASAQTCNGSSGTVSSNTDNMCVLGSTQDSWSNGWADGLWSSSNSSVLSVVRNGKNATLTAIGLGTADVIYTLKEAGCPDKVSLKTITVGPVGAVSADQSICTGNNIRSNITITSATGTIQWKRSDNAAFTANVINVGTNSKTLTIAEVGTLTATKYFRAEVTGGLCGSGISGIVTVSVNAFPTTANAGIDQAVNNSSFTMAANTPTVGAGAWSIASGLSMLLSQFSSTTNPTATFTPAVSGTYVLNWTISNGGCSSSDQVVIANSVLVI